MCIRDSGGPGKGEVQPVQPHAPQPDHGRAVLGALAHTVQAVVALAQPYIVLIQLQRRAALRAHRPPQLAAGGPGLAVHLGGPEPEIPPVPALRAEQLFQLLRLVGVFCKPPLKVQKAADRGGVFRVAERVVKSVVFGNAQPLHHRLQRHALALLPGALAGKYPLQIVPFAGPALIQTAQHQILLEHGHVVLPPLTQWGIRPAPLGKTAQALLNGHARIQLSLGQAGDLGHMVMQPGEDAGLHGQREAIHRLAIPQLHCADLDDLTPQGLLHALILEGSGLIAHVPFHVKNHKVSHLRLPFLLFCRRRFTERRECSRFCFPGRPPAPAPGRAGRRSFPPAVPCPR